ncbi:MAG: ATP-binding protein [Bryobacteraceae bacterium]|nr:ATP-binding protein [Bryobacteraceae bacterium]
MSRALAEDMIRMHARQLKLPSIARGFEHMARDAKEHSWTYEEFLRQILDNEVRSRSESVVRQRLAAARFPELKTLEDFDLSQTQGIEPQTLAELASCDWIEQARNVIIAGPIGTGKTHLGIALGVEAARKRMRVFFTRAADLVRQLVEARDRRELGLLQKKLRRAHLLIVDELGFVPFDRHGGELLFNVIAECYEKQAVLVTTNLAFSEWTHVFAGDEKLTTALLDRLAHHSAVITTRGQSFRMRSSQKKHKET